MHEGESNSHDHDLSMTTKQEFLAFKKKYGKTYPTQEEDDYRFGVFVSHLRKAKRNQLDDPNAIHGVTKFSDLTQSEFRNQYLNLAGQIQLSNHLKKAPILHTIHLPRKFDWRELGALTAIKDQGTECGSCWTFAAIASLEGANFVANQKLMNLSEQQLLDCSHECFTRNKQCNGGCDGGYSFLAYKYMAKAGGVSLAQDYPYTETSGSCQVDKTKLPASVQDCLPIVEDEGQYAANLVKYGPIAVSIDGDRLNTNVSGISCPPCTDVHELGHEVVLVGYGLDGHWIIKNSWGTDFGEDGYYLLCKGGLICNKNPLATLVIAAPNASSYQASVSGTTGSGNPSLQPHYMLIIMGSYVLFYVYH